MQRSATGKTERCANGFTLLEVLVVVAIAAIVTSLVVLRLGDWRAPGNPATQLERLAALIDHQCEQALFQSRPRGLRVYETGYDFWQSAREGWVPVPEGDLGQPREWVGGLDVELTIDGRPVPLGDKTQSPQIVCQPMGELTAFSLRLRTGDQSPSLSGEPGGRLALERD